MQLVRNLSSIILDAKNAEDASVMIIEYFDRLGVPLKERFELNDSVIYALMIERATHSSEILRNKLAIAIAQDIESGISFTEIARLALDMIYHFGIELDTISSMDDELDCVARLLRDYQDDANMAAVALIGYLDRNGYEIEANGYLDNDELYGEFACHL